MTPLPLGSPPALLFLRRVDFFALGPQRRHVLDDDAVIGVIIVGERIRREGDLRIRLDFNIGESFRVVGTVVAVCQSPRLQDVLEEVHVVVVGPQTPQRAVRVAVPLRLLELDAERVPQVLPLLLDCDHWKGSK